MTTISSEAAADIAELIVRQTNQVWAVQSPRAVEQTALRAHWSLQTRPEYLGF
jgi:hypothetical protein